MKHSIFKTVSLGAVMLSLLGLLANGCGSGEDFGSGGSGTATGGSGSGTGGSGSGGEAVQEFGIRLGGPDIDGLSGVEKISDTQLIVYGYTKGTNMDFNEDGEPDATGQGGLNDSFIASYDLSGNYQWGYQLGGSEDDRILGSKKLKNGNILIYGIFSSAQLNLDANPQTAELSEWSGASDSLFFATYDPQGNLKWAQRLSGDLMGFFEDMDPVKTIEVLDNGSILVTGEFIGKFVNFNNDNNNEVQNMNAFNKKSYMVNYDANSGDLLWAQIQKIENADLRNVDIYGSYVFPNDDILIYGHSDLGYLYLDNTQPKLDDINTDFYFLARYKSNGQLVWANKFKSTALIDETLYDLKVTEQSIFIGGKFKGGFQIGNMTLVGKANYNGFTTSVNPSTGNVKWVKGQQGDQDEYTQTLVPLPNDAVVVVGNYQSPQLEYGGNTPLSSAGQTDAFVIAYDSSGNPQWGNRIAGAGDEKINQVHVLSDGRVLVEGNFDGSSVDIDGDNNPDLNNLGENDLFLVVYQVDGSIEWYNPIQSSCSDDDITATHLAVNGNDTIMLLNQSNNCIEINYDKNPNMDLSASSPFSYLVSYDSHGAVLSSVLINKASDFYFSGFNVLADKSGFAWNEDFMFKTNADGQLAWQLIYNENDGGFYPKAAVEFPGSIVIVGEFMSDKNTSFPNLGLSNGGSDVFILKYKQ